MMDVARILIVAPVCSKPRVLGAFLTGLDNLLAGEHELEYLFTDDNQDRGSSELLRRWAKERDAEVMAAPPRIEPYACTDERHHWSCSLIERVGLLKDRMIEHALSNRHDAILLVDADLVLHPRTLLALVQADKDIVAEVFWTEFERGGPELPNVWACDAYKMVPPHAVDLAEEERNALATEFLSRLRRPGLHPVGGLGACTLVRRPVLAAGVRFAALPNVSWHGEDRHFCLRATALGFELVADTHFPPLHLYREADLDHVEKLPSVWAEQTERWTSCEAVRQLAISHCGDIATIVREHLPSSQRRSLGAVLTTVPEVDFTVRANVVDLPDLGTAHVANVGVEVDLAAALAGRTLWRGGLNINLEMEVAPSVPAIHCSRRRGLTLTMLVRNEADRFLQDVVSRLLPLVDDAVIIDDASTDETPALCESLLHGVRHEIVRLRESRFAEEHELRSLQWMRVVAHEPDWILNVDADELFDADAVELLREHVRFVREPAVAFRLFDMWDHEHFRADEHWTAHTRWWPLLVRWNGSTQGTFPRWGQHGFRWPLELISREVFRSPLRVQHLGWMRPEDRREKHARYLRCDPDMAFSSRGQVESILDEAPRLERWQPIRAGEPNRSAV